MEKSPEHRYYSEAQNKYIEAPKKQLFRLQIPFGLRFSIIWVLFFIIIGIGIQSFIAKRFVFSDFFAVHYADWLTSFKGFFNQSSYSGLASPINLVLGKWYYFFYTGGWLALLWNLLSWIIHAEVVIKKPEPKIEIPRHNLAKPLVPEVKRKKIDAHILNGYKSLARGQVHEAKSFYDKIKQEYDHSIDPEKEVYAKILEFYNELAAKG